MNSCPVSSAQPILQCYNAAKRKPGALARPDSAIPDSLTLIQATLRHSALFRNRRIDAGVRVEGEQRGQVADALCVLDRKQEPRQPVGVRRTGERLDILGELRRKLRIRE